MLQAILEARACGTGSGDAQFRWDYNADGDFNDGGEGWTDAGVNSGTYYFHYAMKDFRLPTFLGDTVIYPKIKLAAEVQTPLIPIGGNAGSGAIDRMCPISAKAGWAGGPDDNLLLTKQTINDRTVDRAMRWMLTQLPTGVTTSTGTRTHMSVR